MVIATPRSTTRAIASPKVADRPAVSTSVSLKDVFKAGLRLEAGAFAIELRRIVSELESAPYPTTALYGDGGLCREAHNAFRFRRIWVNSRYGVPLLSSSDIISVRPMDVEYISRALTPKLEQLLIRKGDVLISCSGTVGNVSLAGETIAGMALSQHAIRLRAPDFDTAGYVTAFLRSRYGRVQLVQGSYGSVVVHIEPEHLERVRIPDLPSIRRIAIGSEMWAASQLRDRANVLLDEADDLLHERLQLRPLREVAPRSRGSNSHQVRASQLAGRLDASFHGPRTALALEQLSSQSAPVMSLGARQVTKEIRAITKFRKRTYVPRGGIPMLSSKQLFQIDPVDVKRLAKGAHTKDLAEIALEPDMIAITRSGTIGKVQIIPEYMKGWTASEDATRVLSAESMDPGYLYAWLASDYGRQLIARHSYGSVVLHVDLDMLSSVPVPVPSAETREAIGAKVREANAVRDEAWRRERAAIAQLEGLIAKH